MSLIRVRVLDGIGVWRDGRTVALQPKRLLLLVYLLLESRDAAVRRDRLLAIFWPESDTEHARNALRQALFALRSALGAEVVIARGSMELVVDETLVQCDALEILNAVALSEHHTVDRLYRAEFLASLHANDSPELEQWLEDARLRFRRFATTAVRMLAMQHDLSPSERIRHLERLHMLAPYDESVAMELVTLHAKQGDRAAAVETFRRFSSRLWSDLEIEPSDAFKTLLADAKSTDVVVPSTAAAVPTSTPAVGETRSRVARRRPRGAAIGLVLFACLGVLLSLRSKTDLQLVDVEPFTVSWQDSAQALLAARTAVLASDRLRGVIATLPGFRVLGVQRGGLRSRRAGTVVRGSLESLQAGRWRGSASVLATESEMLLQRIEVEGAASDSVVSALIDQVSAVVATRLNMELSWGVTLHRPGSLNALSLFQRGFEAVERGDAEEGVERFARAWALDSSFLFAGILAAGNALAIDAFSTGDSLLAALAPYTSRMLPLEQRQYQRAVALSRANTLGVLVESRAIVQLEPRVPFLLAQLAQDAWLANRPREAVAALDRIDAMRGQPATDASTATIRAAALHAMGQFAEELATIDAFLSRTAAESHSSGLRIPPLAALGAIDTLHVMLAAVASREPARDLARPYRLVALELAAHGDTAASRNFFLLGERWIVTQQRSNQQAASRVISALELLIDAGSWSRADSLLARHRSLLDSATSVSARSALFALRGVLFAATERPQQAREVGDSLAALASRGRNGVETYRRARISAALGEDSRALALIAQAIAEGFVNFRDLHLEPAFARLRADTRFQAITTPQF